MLRRDGSKAKLRPLHWGGGRGGLHVRKMTLAAARGGREQGEQGGEDSCGDGEEPVRAVKSPSRRDASWVGVEDPGSSGFWLQVTADQERPAGEGKGAEVTPLPRCMHIPK